MRRTVWNCATFHCDIVGDERGGEWRFENQSQQLVLGHKLVCKRHLWAIESSFNHNPCQNTNSATWARESPTWYVWATHIPTTFPAAKPNCKQKIRRTRHGQSRCSSVYWLQKIDGTRTATDINFPRPSMTAILSLASTKYTLCWRAETGECSLYRFGKNNGFSKA